MSVRIWIWALADCVGDALYLDLVVARLSVGLGQGQGSGLVNRLHCLRTLQCSHCELISFSFLRLIQPSMTCSFLGMSGFTDTQAKKKKKVKFMSIRKY